MKFTDKGRQFVIDMIAMHEGADALLFATEEVDGGLSLSMHITAVQEGDRVLEFDGLKVICDEALEHVMGDITFDEEGGELSVIEPPVMGGCAPSACASCGCGCGSAPVEEEETDCGCGGCC